MVNQIVRQANIGGLIPTIHSAQSGDIRVISGRNFRWHYDGPLSGWGNQLVSQDFGFCFDHFPYYGLFHFDDKSILTTPHGIYEQKNNCWEKVFNLEPNNLCLAEQDYPWSTAFVGDSYYFSHPTIGIVKFDRFKCVWSYVEFNCCTEENKPNAGMKFYDFSEPEIRETNTVFGIAEAANRLIVLGRDIIAHSEIDNGENLNCDPFCGGGFVSSSIAKYGKPLGVFKVYNGFAALTSNAIIHARELESMAGFNYKAVTYNNPPVNPHAICQFGEGWDILYLAKSGIKLLALNRETLIVNDFELEVSSWLVEKELIRQKWLSIPHSVKFYYSEETSELFISLLDPEIETPKNMYSRSLVYNLKYKKWASFDQDHFCIGPANGRHHRSYGYTLGFFGGDFGIHWFDYNECNERYDHVKGRGSYSLDSYIEIGLFTLTSDQSIDLYSEIQRIKLFTEGNQKLLNSRASAVANSSGHQETYDRLSKIPFNAVVKVSSSNDGYNRILSLSNKIENMDSNLFSQNVENYTCEGHGVYHSVIVQALGVREFYSVNRIDAQLKANGTIA